MLVYAVVDDDLSPDFRLGVELEVFVRRSGPVSGRDEQPFVWSACESLLADPNVGWISLHGVRFKTAA